MEQSYSITQNGRGEYIFSGRTTLDDGGSMSREYARGDDLDAVRATGVELMAQDALSVQTTVVESGKLDEAHAKVAAMTSTTAVRVRALSKLTTEELSALGL